MSYTLAIKDKEGKYQRFTVPLEVSLYVKQLEAFIMLPGISKLKEAYPERFAEAPDLLTVCKALHHAIDILFAMLIESKEGFFPSKSGLPWEAIQQSNCAIAKAEKRG